MSQDEVKQSSQPEGRNSFLLFVGGAMLLGFAIALLLFGNSLFSAGAGQISAEPGALDQAPFQPIQTISSPLAAAVNRPQIGDVAYDFALRDLDGNTITLSELRGQPVIINFWATWCAPCRVEMPELQAAYEKYQEEGLVILALDQDEPPDVVRAFFYDELGLTFTPLLDERGTVATVYGVLNFPSTYFVNAEGVITAFHLGPLNQSQIETYLVDTIPGQS